MTLLFIEYTRGTSSGIETVVYQLGGDSPNWRNGREAAENLGFFYSARHGMGFCRKNA